MIPATVNAIAVSWNGGIRPVSVVNRASDAHSSTATAPIPVALSRRAGSSASPWPFPDVPTPVCVSCAFTRPPVRCVR